MSSDRTRISYDQNQQYRSVVAQQGRVTLESDFNEAQVILSEELREETLDFVGSNGTPDNGYEISATTTPFDFAISAGTMYVGGIRAVLPKDITYSQQLDWLDKNPLSEPPWIEPSTLQNNNIDREFIYLYLSEQEVSAIEDSALKEIALGGPDTTQRTRLIQKIVRLTTSAEDCNTALGIAKKYWIGQGLEFDPQTMQLRSNTKLKVSFQPQITPPDLCEPEARGGYLGAENQLIRVQISGTNKLIWSYDNASFLYRVNWINNKTLQLQSRPVDDFHQPRKDQFVEVLKAGSQLSNGEYIAASTGFVTKLAAAYNPDTKQVALTGDITNDTKQLFLRIWEEEITFTLGVSVTLGNTGVEVTIQISGSPVHIGDYWQIAVRPGEPTSVYPQRYQQDFQPPDGARVWICPLAVISWNDGVFQLIQDCRNPFDNLVELTKRKLGGCCTVTVKPEDFTQDKTLQQILDRYKNQEKITICLLPGDYFLPAPLQLGREHSNLTLEGCHDGAVFYAATGTEKNFLHGMIILDRANNVTLRRLRFQLPLVPFINSGGQLAGLKAEISNRYVGELLPQLSVSIGIRPLHCAVLAIEDCLFRFTIEEQVNVFGVGIFAGSECHGLTVLRTRFVHDDEYLRTFGKFPYRVLVGFLLSPTVIIKGIAEQNSSGIVLPSLLQDATFRDNLFSGMTIAMFSIADHGLVRIEDNTVRDCYAGLWLFSFDFIASLLNDFNDFNDFNDQNINIIGGEAFLIGTILGQGFPLPENFDLSDALQVDNNPVGDLDLNLSQNFMTWLTNINIAGIVSSTLFPDFIKLIGIFSSIQIRALQQVPARPRFTLSFHLLNNNIDTSIKEGSSNIGLILIGNIRRDEAEEINDSILMATNKICNRATIPTVLVAFSEYVTVTGNLILNMNTNREQRQSLVLYATAIDRQSGIFAQVITGNVFQGRPILPPRKPEPPAPLNTWEFLNTVF